MRLAPSLLLLPLVATTAGAAPRLAVPSPQLTELLHQLGKSGDIVATVDPVPEGARLGADVAKLGSLYQPSVERTIASRPDWVVVDSSIASRGYLTALRAAGLRSLEIDIGSLADLERETARLLRIVYGEARSEALDRFLPCARALRGSQRKSRFSYLALTWITPPIAFGRVTLLADLLAAMGGESALPEAFLHPFPLLSEEWLVARTFDTLYFLSHGDAVAATKAAESSVRRWWPTKAPRLVGLDAERFARASFSPLESLGSLLPPGGALPGSCEAIAARP